jgi:hypothetical protein
MDFDIREISLVQPIAPEARVELSKLPGTTATFRQSIELAITFPDPLPQSPEIVDPAQTLTGLFNWARVYRRPEDQSYTLHVIAPVERGDGELAFYRIDLRQPPMPKRGLRPAAELLACNTLDYNSCAAGLVDLAFHRATNRDSEQRYAVLARPCPISLPRIRMACVCPEILGAHRLATRLAAIGQVFGAEILHIGPRGYRDVKARLANATQLDAVLISQRFAPYIGQGAVPASVRPEMIDLCTSEDAAGIEEQAIAWIELCQQALSQKSARAADADATLLALMLQGMVNHDKIGQFNHCPKPTVLRRLRARHLNVAVAEAILDTNSEAYEEKRESAAYFLWKDHNDGRQYFLNPKLMEEIRERIAATLG